MAYTIEQARHLYNLAWTLELSGRELLKDAELVVQQCNGIGAAWTPDSMRKLCTELNPVMELPACIHDRRYSIGTTKGDRQFADNEFLANCQICIKAKYAWWNPARYVMLRRAKRFHTLLRAFGGIAFNDGKGGDTK